MNIINLSMISGRNPAYFFLLNSAIDITEDYFAGWSNAVINRNLVKVTKSGNLVNASVFITVNKQIDILTVCNIKEKYLPADALYIWNPLIENASGYPYIGMVQINKPEKAIELRSSNKSTTLGVLFSLCYIIG